MDRQVGWEWVGAPGLEHLRVRGVPAGVNASGIVVGRLDGRLLKVRYRVECGPGFVFREAGIEVEPAEGPGSTRRIARTDSGAWTVDGVARPDLAGCIDIDVMVTPYTNTLPIRRLGLAEGDAATIEVAYVRLPDLDVAPQTQVYARLAADRYRYESAASGFTAELTIDSDGLVIDYGDIWRRAG